MATESLQYKQYSWNHQPYYQKIFPRFCGDKFLEEPVALLPARGLIEVSRAPREEHSQIFPTCEQRLIGLTSPPLRIGLHCEQGHPREVKKYGEKPNHAADPAAQWVNAPLCGEVGNAFVLLSPYALWTGYQCDPPLWRHERGVTTTCDLTLVICDKQPMVKREFPYLLGS